MLTLALPRALAAATPSPCPAGQTSVMSCQADKKTIALCTDGGQKPTFLQYRIGPSDVVATKPALLVPADVKGGLRALRVPQGHARHR